ncbi:MAG TPA: sugar O-acetyltransferase [Armatimonadota bacterium]|nr:sugar O-acetyltransferase [Armatimonadota bacterium]
MDNIARRDHELPYIADAAVIEEIRAARKLLYALNSTDLSDMEKLVGLTYQLLGKAGHGAFINPPFYCDYGRHIEVGDHFFANFNCTIIDVAKVLIGDNVLLGPNVAIYTAGHPVHPIARKSGYEYGIPVTIGDNVWIGGNAVVCPGVQIGANTVIGAGSVVSKDIPSNVIAAGNPCKVIREITDEDMKHYYKDRCFDEEAWSTIMQGR